MLSVFSFWVLVTIVTANCQTPCKWIHGGNNIFQPNISSMSKVNQIQHHIHSNPSTKDEIIYSESSIHCHEECLTDSCFFSRNLIESIPHDCHAQRILLLYDISIVDYETEESGASLRNIQLAKDLLNQHFRDNLRYLLFWTNVLNHFALIQSTFGELEQSLEALTHSQNMYLQWKANPTDNVLNLIEAFDEEIGVIRSRSASEVDRNLETTIEKNYTETIYFMAQVLQSLGQNDKSAEMCMQTLKRQADFGDFDALDWAVNAGTLCQYFASHDDFLTARHLLASSFIMIERVKETESNQELLSKRKADLDRIFTKYCLMLLEGPTVSEAPKATERILDYAVVVEKEEGIPVSIPKNYEEAVVIFNAGVKHVSSALQFFTLNEHASDHADCILDQSKLYRLLASFQPQADKVCKLHKRRVDLLQELLKQLNPTHFLSYNRKINFELGETFSEMIHFKTVEKSSSESVTKQAALKVTSFINKSIEHFQQFLDTFVDKTTKKIKDNLDDEDVRPVIVALLNQGRLHSKLKSSDPKLQLKYLTDSETCYRKAVDYLERNPSKEAIVKEEATVLRELLQLLPERTALVMSSMNL